MHLALILFLFSTKFRNSAQCTHDLPDDRLSRSLVDNSLVLDEVGGAGPSSQPPYHPPAIRQSQNLNSINPTPQVDKIPSTSAAEPSTPQSPQDKIFLKDFSATNPAINQSLPNQSALSSPKVTTPLLHDAQPKITDKSSATKPSAPLNSSTTDHDTKKRRMILTREFLVAICTLALSLLLLGILWLVLIVFHPIIRSSKPTFLSRGALFTKKKKIDPPPQWWTQFPLTSEFDQLEAPSVNKAFGGAGSTPGSPQVASNSEVASEFKPKKALGTGVDEEEVLKGPGSEWQQEQTRINGRLDSWLRGMGERGKLFSAAVV
ncbi:hypothetical protein VP01_84g15 [Puccinia sorghi]|uniref:Uncharacterized protein n=1 Tax=Puccinia sorghi TaxID=27349 RepID=A0A0L6UBB3_9BASI|nr:hypothetical protein VP01_84g15 [Puccinia sorghi]